MKEQVTLSCINATIGEGLGAQVADLRRLSATAVTDGRHALTEVEDPGVVGLAAADLVDVYVAAREST